MIQFVLMVNKQGQTRLAKYFNSMTVRERVTLEGELIRKCLSRTEHQCSFLEHRQFKVIYRRYASLYFIVGVDNEEDVVSFQIFFVNSYSILCFQNELSLLEFIHNLVETLDKYFENVCELDIMFNIEKAHFIIDEMVMSGYITESNKANILNPVIAVVKSEGK